MEKGGNYIVLFTPSKHYLGIDVGILPEIRPCGMDILTDTHCTVRIHKYLQKKWKDKFLPLGMSKIKTTNVIKIEGKKKKKIRRDGF